MLYKFSVVLPTADLIGHFTQNSQFLNSFWPDAIGGLFLAKWYILGIFWLPKREVLSRQSNNKAINKFYNTRLFKKVSSVWPIFVSNWPAVENECWQHWLLSKTVDFILVDYRLIDWLILSRHPFQRHYPPVGQWVHPDPALLHNIFIQG